MNPAEYQAMYRVEDTLWWYQGMRRISSVLIGDRMTPGSRILDAGCGTGGNLAWIDGDTPRLGKHRTGFGVDLSEKAMGFCQARNLERVAQASVCDLPFASESWGCRRSFDVI
jgi:SAM-dependent methyltransferase